ncbi:Shwachman-Bodian-Diamond syndrome protein [Heterostelium album PN500]|uniref:Shwachman-Bodian-Diamond syndrome protein n=1 Tax=Heterostelium pallidum (strain ATCC 26659 / Pp 5 / PN500) TaxID=670386 RepID=D3B9B9_HETP5|nr:Shwachman-Bodian-Diamond syndrome protein [Heterostelium album PN500]EFA81831.1 Shwachman-Bodian-Diamond syndrome protein [Heterostelium album PN500]|eukprot:XP_020433948.1 Shwachman-Bodian-Diamond syndrome protein [Heterostelium album PN500]
MSIFTPVNNKTLTNVAIVRYKKGGARFEIACYPSKVTSWRTKVEKDLNEVIQIHRIFTNVSKGVVAKKDELIKAFGTDDEREILLQILDKGELQVSSKERESHSDQTFRDIATIVAEKCVNPETQRPIPVGIIEKAMKDVHYSLHPTKSSKQQSLEVIKLISTVIPIQRAQMRLNITVPGKDARLLRDKLAAQVAKIEEEDYDNGMDMVCLIDPGAFRKLDDFVKFETKGKGFIEIMSLAVAKEEKENEERVIYINNINTIENRKYGNNYIRTSKYTILTFLPKNLFHQVVLKRDLKII